LLAGGRDIEHCPLAERVFHKFGDSSGSFGLLSPVLQGKIGHSESSGTALYGNLT
jgi:hypothetical protein